MKLIVKLIISLILLLPASIQGQWKRVYAEIESEPNSGMEFKQCLSDVLFLNRDIGYIVGSELSIHGEYVHLYMTEDGGKTWSLIFEKYQRITSVQFLNESRGFATYRISSEDLLKSSDGGHSWTRDSTLGKVKDVFFLNDSIGWTYGAGGVYKTEDGGDSWYSYSTELKDLRSLYFIDDSTGWAVGEMGFITKYTLNDGWETLPAVTDLPLKKVLFIGRNNGWISGGYMSNDSFIPIFLKTIDGGETWEKIPGIKFLMNDFYFDTRNHGWAVGEDNYNGVILETFNGGSEWEVVKNTPERLNSLTIIDGHGWAVGDSGLIVKCDSVATGIKEDKINRNNKLLFQNYPNPFSSNTTITYQLQSSGNVKLCIYDLSGRKVATLVNETQLADKYEIEWNTEGMRPGIYFCELKTGQGRQVMKMSIVR